MQDNDNDTANENNNNNNQCYNKTTLTTIITKPKITTMITKTTLYFPRCHQPTVVAKDPPHPPTHPRTNASGT